MVNGNFKNFIYDNSVTNSLLLNALQQIMISILSFHHFTDGYFHNDCHYKNFLFYKIKPGGCFHYNINGIDYYIENIGFLWSTWDYGLVSKLYYYGDYINDIMRIDLTIRKRNLNIEQQPNFKKHNIYGKYNSGYLPNNVLFTDEVKNLQENIWKHIVDDLSSYTNVNIILKRGLTEDLWFKYLLDNNILYSKVPIGKILSSTKIKIPEYKGQLIIKEKMPFDNLF